MVGLITGEKDGVTWLPRTVLVREIEVSHRC
jgi:hypothetical protein